MPNFLLALASICGIALMACTDEAAEPDTREPPQIAGVYEASGAGEISRLALANGEYLLVTSTCATEADPTTCARQGSYVLDDARATIVLTDAADGAVRSMAVAVLERGIAPSPSAQPRGLCIVGGDGVFPACPPQLVEPPSSTLVTPAPSTIVECATNCAVTIEVNGQPLVITGDGIRLTIPPNGNGQ